MIACCGIDCTACEARIATEKDDDALRAKVAETWSKKYQADIKAEQIQCSGCRAEGVKFFYCESMCPVRACCAEKAVDTCADCADYACEKVENIHKMAPDAKKALDGLRNG